MILLLSQFSFGLFVMATLLTLASIFMILLILVQQGRGGGLTGALGGMGGQSAFGTKAGDLFTRITIVTAVIWIMLSILTIAFFNRPTPTAMAAPPTGFGSEAEETAVDDKIPTDPLQAEKDIGLDENTKLNPPSEAIPSESKSAEDNKVPETKDNAAPNAPPPATDPTAPAQDADKSNSEPTDKSDKSADDQTPSSSDGGKQRP